MHTGKLLGDTVYVTQEASSALWQCRWRCAEGEPYVSLYV